MASDHYETLQQVFDDAYRGLATQGFQKSGVPGAFFSCRYRDEHGRRCAIGHCIPDHLYTQDIEGSTPDQDGFEQRFGSLFNGVSREALCDLQAVHDQAESAPEMEVRLSEFASDRELTIPSFPA